MSAPPDALRLRAVLLAVFVIAGCGLGYELAAGTLASERLGDSVTQFSTTIGLYLCALGVGAWLSKLVPEARLADRFVQVEAAVALVGGTMACQLLLAYETAGWFRVALYVELLATGTLVGLEVPLLLRLLRPELSFKDLVSQVLAFDYVGSLAVSLAFALWMRPVLGSVRAPIAFGLANAFVALWSTWLFERRLVRPGLLRAQCAVVVLVLAGAAAWADALRERAHEAATGERVLLARRSPYQSIVLSERPGGFALWLNDHLQFDSRDEHRYHEALVHPAMAASPDPRRVLVLGGGDGLAAREALRHGAVERLTLVDLDAEVTGLAREVEAMVRQNGGALSDPRVEVVTDDAMAWLDAHRGPFDVAIADFPDPSSYGVGKLYTQRFYRLLLGALAPDGVLVVQATSPFHARRSFWCVARTLESVGLAVLPYRATVGSFGGDWGFLLASRRRLEPPGRVPAGVRSLDGPSMRALFVLPPDVGPVEVEVNRLDTQVLVRYYEDEWRAVGG